jgi:hypothetical protein
MEVFILKVVSAGGKKERYGLGSVTWAGKIAGGKLSQKLGAEQG